MFQIIRGHFAAAAGGSRWQRLVGLFLFEFVVVLLGVLAAQGVQSWAKEREAEEFARDELTRLTIGYYGARETGEVWRVANPCLRRGVESVMRAAAMGTAPDASLLQRPRLFNSSYPDATPENLRRMRGMIGNDATLALGDARGRAEDMTEYMQSILKEWEKFRLLDPAFGPVSVQDRAAVRAAGIDILIALRNIEIAVINLDELAPTQREADPEPFDPEVDSEPVSDCAEIWRTGRIYRGKV